MYTNNSSDEKVTNIIKPNVQVKRKIGANENKTSAKRGLGRPKNF